MEIKFKKQNLDGVMRLESKVSIKEIQIKEDIFNPDSEKIDVCFKGKNSSGIISLSPTEVEQLAKIASKNLRLVKSVKLYRD